MGRTPHIPSELKRGPFTFREALCAGLRADSLRGKAWRHLGPELYCWKGWHEDPWLVLSAWTRLLPSDAVFGGGTTAWLWGVEGVRMYPIEVILRPASSVRTRRGLNIRRCSVDPDDIKEARGLRVTSVHRTLCDLSAQWHAVEALVAIDATLRLGRTTSAALMSYAHTAAGRRGASRLRSLASIAEPAESPMETRLRWLLHQAGLPRPLVQTELRNSDGRFVGRADLFYPEARLVIEYDGANHRDRVAEDNRRQNLLVNAGFTLLRFTASDLDQPELIASQVRAALLRSRL